MKYNLFDMLPEKAFQPVGKRMTLEGGGGGGKGAPSMPAPVAAPKAEEKQASVAPANDATTSNNGLMDSNRVGKSKLRIDLNPVVAGQSSAGSSAGNGLAVSG